MPSLQCFLVDDSVEIDRKTISDQVFERLRKGIFSGKFQPGQSVNELPLAQAFGVSQSSVRVALQLLSQHGLVVQKPNRDSCIPKPV